MQIQPELKSVLKRLRLSGILATLPDRWAYARQEKLDYSQFLELVLSDEIERRDHKNLANRLQTAGFEEECTLERFDWSAKIHMDKARLTELFGLHFIERHENVIFLRSRGCGQILSSPGAGPRRLPRRIPGAVPQGRPAVENAGPFPRRQLLRPGAALLYQPRFTGCRRFRTEEAF